MIIILPRSSVVTIVLTINRQTPTKVYKDGGDSEQFIFIINFFCITYYMFTPMEPQRFSWIDIKKKDVCKLCRCAFG